MANEVTVRSKCQAENGDESDQISKDKTQVISDSDNYEQWLQNCSISDGESQCSSEFTSEFSSENVAVHLLLPDSKSTEFIGSSLVEGQPNRYGDVQVANSKHVIIGNVTYVTGPVYITQTTSNVHQQRIVNQINENHADERLRIIPRINWLAQPPFTKTVRPKPVQYVIIGHTQTEEAFTLMENTRILRCIQAYHIRCRKWDDIAYNFLIGSDGNVYEGRGWTHQGSHTLGYNHKSICIVFIGDFIEHLPPPAALTAAKALIQLGVDLGHIPPDYTLVGHCQLRPFDSPGRPIFDEIKKWPRWSEITVSDNQETKLISFFEFLNSERSNLEV